jgi:cytochrome c oxidase cbb3-type subunit 2
MSGKQLFEMDEKRLVIGAMVTLSLATGVMVLMPYFFVKRITPPKDLKPYTVLEARGREIYVAQGCVYCHSQQPRDAKQAPDAKRGWGRVSVAGDYFYDSPHLLGTMRTGPDLFNIAARQPSKDWHLGHLYQPRAYTPGSIMPAYPFMFEVKKTQDVTKDDEVVNLPPEFAKAGETVVTKADAHALVAYLLALDHTYSPLPAIPVPGDEKKLSGDK